LLFRFTKLIWGPGNHESWTTVVESEQVILVELGDRAFRAKFAAGDLQALDELAGAHEYSPAPNCAQPFSSNFDRLSAIDRRSEPLFAARPPIVAPLKETRP
jgi:hypothetical protein